MADPKPAIRKVQEALAALESVTIGSRTFLDRAENEPLQEGETPGRVIRVVNTTFALEEGMTMHRATVQVDFVSGVAAGTTIDAINQRAIGEFIASIHADRTLGGMMQMLEEQDAGPSDQFGADTGAATLTLEAWFFTPRGDFNTIVGQAGATF